MPERAASAREGSRGGADFEELLAECFDRLEAGDGEALEDICAREPSHAGDLRRKVSEARSLGFLGEAAPGGGDEFPDRLGEFRLIERIGGGGMGVVFRAAQDGLEREVALKLIRPEHLFFPRSRERFRREAQAIARLKHPGIVPVHAVGEERGVPYFVMELIEGASLAALLEDLASRGADRLTSSHLGDALRRRAEPDAHVSIPQGESWETLAVRLVRRVAESLEHAHSRGVLHRDVKPSNIMVTPGGRAMLLDFGLARDDGKTKVTRSGHMLGSLPYMAPEQLLGDAAAVDARTDVYALGVTLFEMLTLACPFEAPSSEEVRRHILEGRRPALRAANPRVSWELETVCLTAIDPDRRRRYVTAGDFARDLGCVLSGQPIEARRASWPRRMRAWGRRRPAAAVAVLAALLLAVVWPTAFMIQQRRTLEAVRAQERQTRAARNEAVAQRNLAEQRLEVANLRLRTLRTVILTAAPQNASGQDVTLRQVLGRMPAVIEDELADLPVSAAELYGDLARSFRDLGDGEKAIEMAERGLSLLREHAPRHVLTPLLRQEVGLCRLQLGDAAGAESALRDAVTLHRDLEGETQFLANMLGNLARALLESGRTEDAVVTCKAALAVFERAGGTDEKIHLDLERRYCDALRQGGDLESAEERIRILLEITGQTRGEHSYEAAQALNSLALVLGARGKLDEAEAVSRRALTAFKALLGPEHVFVGPLLYSHGAVLMRRGKIDEAEDAFLDAIELLETHGGSPQHLATAYAHYAGFARDHLDDPKTAIEHFEKALATTARIGPTPRDAERLLQLGFLRLRAKDVKGAESAFRRSNSGFESSGRAADLLCGNARFGLGVALFRTERVPEAEEAFRRALAVYDDIPRAAEKAERTKKWIEACRARR